MLPDSRFDGQIVRPPHMLPISAISRAPGNHDVTAAQLHPRMRI